MFFIWNSFYKKVQSTT